MTSRPSPLSSQSDIAAETPGDDPTGALAALVTSRICHDLISPVGAIDNGVELIEAMNVGTSSPEMVLIGESARSAAAKLRLFRLAFGAAGADGVSRGRELEQLFTDCFTKPRLRFSWAGGPRDMARSEAKMLALALLCADSALPLGGLLTAVTGEKLRIEGTGPRIKLDPRLAAALESPQDVSTFRAGEVQFLLARLQAATIGRPIALDLSEERLTLTI
ncbi:histidine phosphotransferase family protein [Pontivivens ytuae]|uniref:Histidine phosphotransferase n=1 Tax=Pontivivens ytuae TaxID=2789856 RepID=A0A7S9LTJ1_9RHOB|nr:histidine phosphotransferase family protein [Pontivivens ytuae]QPH55014.1 histidine phosphotransferase [Pontivivens ytuae]